MAVASLARWRGSRTESGRAPAPPRVAPAATSPWTAHAVDWELETAVPRQGEAAVAIAGRGAGSATPRRIVLAARAGGGHALERRAGAVRVAGGARLKAPAAVPFWASAQPGAELLSEDAGAPAARSARIAEGGRGSTWP